MYCLGICFFYSCCVFAWVRHAKRGSNAICLPASDARQLPLLPGVSTVLPSHLLPLWRLPLVFPSFTKSSLLALVCLDCKKISFNNFMSWVTEQIKVTILFFLMNYYFHEWWTSTYHDSGWLGVRYSVFLCSNHLKHFPKLVNVWCQQPVSDIVETVLHLSLLY